MSATSGFNDSTPEGSRYVCHACIGDEILAKQVEEEAAPAECSYCQLTEPALTLGGLSDRIHRVLEDHFELFKIEEDENQEELRTYLVETVIAKIADLQPGIAEDVADHLFNTVGTTIAEEKRDEKSLQPRNLLLPPRGRCLEPPTSLERVQGRNLFPCAVLRGHHADQVG